MNSTPDTPIYNLKAVVRETGLKPDTLRAWERRYGLPIPQRTLTGHRLYSQNDINLLKWLMARQTEGMSISRAVELWQRMQDTESAGQGGQFAPREQPWTGAGEIGSALLAGATIDQLSTAWIKSCLEFHEQHAEQTLTQAFALFPVETVCLDLIMRALGKIGEGWYRGEVTVQQEHFASALAMRRLEALLAATPTPTRANRVLVACPPEEGHTFVPLLLALLLRRRGWDVIYLGANVPIQDFVPTARKTKPQLVILTAQLLHTAATLSEMSELLYKECIPLAFGGLVFTQQPELVQRICGHYLGNRVEQAIQSVEQLLQSPLLPHQAEAPTLRYQQALQHFRLYQSQVETEIWRAFGNSGMPPDLLRKGNIYFGRDILAALTLGNLSYLGPNLAWIKGLLRNHYQMPTHMVDSYLAAYQSAITKQLNEQGALIAEWLQRLIES